MSAQANQTAISSMREIWCDWTRLPNQDLNSSLSLSSIDTVIVRPDQLLQISDHLNNHFKKLKVACHIENLDQLSAIENKADVIISCQKEDIRKLKEMHKTVGTIIDIKNAASMQTADQLIPDVNFLILRFFDSETNIPLKLLVAESQRHQTSVIKYVQSLGEALSTRGVLEPGPRGICFSPRSSEEMVESKRKIMYLRNTQIQLQEVEVVRAEAIGIGYRGCVDCTTLFEKDEGILVGSTSAGGILMCSEVHHLPFMDLRPFRVNAGSVHSYVWTPENKTHYITELSAGREVLAVSTSGVARPVQVGRTKIEIRSLRLIEATNGRTRFNVIIEDDWQVRLFGASGSPICSTSIVPGTKLLAFADQSGRRTGIKINEYIAEQ